MNIGENIYIYIYYILKTFKTALPLDFESGFSLNIIRLALVVKFYSIIKWYVYKVVQYIYIHMKYLRKAVLKKTIALNPSHMT